MTSEKPLTHRLLVLITTLLISPVIVLLAYGLAELTDVSHKLMAAPVVVMVLAVPVMRAFNLNLGVLFIIIPSAMVAGMRGAVKRGGGKYLSVLGLLFFCGFAVVMSLLLQAIVELVILKGRRWRNALIFAVLGIYFLVGSAVLYDYVRNYVNWRVMVLPYEKLSLKERTAELTIHYWEDWTDETEWKEAFTTVVKETVAADQSLQELMYKMPRHRFGMTGLKILLDHGADINGGTDRLNPPHAIILGVIDSGHEEMADFVLDQGYDATAIVYGRTALHRVCGASDSQTLPLLERLLTYDIDIDHVDSEGRTALDECSTAKNAQLEMVETLLKKGAKLPRMSGSGYPQRYKRFEDLFKHYDHGNGWIRNK